MVVTFVVNLVEERLWHDVPQFPCHRYTVNLVGILASKLPEELLVHRNLVRMGVEVTLCQFYRLTNHDAKCHLAESQFVCRFESLTNGVAVVDEAMRTHPSPPYREGAKILRTTM